MILKLFLGTVGAVVLEELGENKVDKDDKDKDVSDTSVVDVVAAHPVPEYPSVDITSNTSIASGRRMKRTTVNLRCIASSFVQAHFAQAGIFQTIVSNPRAKRTREKKPQKRGLSKVIDECVSKA
ncbi:MAG TPA: hypothetical protein VEI74_00480 [Candidatus Methylomirabilis sp.]|nr:hypothetical protein [Candidatus Methylomirabilis sp.]